MRALSSLDLSGNRLWALGLKHLSEALVHNQTLSSLDISNNGVTENETRRDDMSGVIALASTIKDMRALSVLSLKSNNLYAVGCKALVEGLKGNHVITELNIADCNLSSGGSDMSGVIALANAIPDMRALSSANLLRNNIGIKQAKALAAILKEHPTLKSLCGNKGDETELDMSGKNMCAEGVIMLVPEIIDNGAMTSLNLAENYMGADGAKHIAATIKVIHCVLALILTLFACPSDFVINCWCLLLSAGHGGTIGAKFGLEQPRGSNAS
jgi:Ran GTPase-activating protein (RanGAP) involved in mRNA processing and transport